MAASRVRGTRGPPRSASRSPSTRRPGRPPARRSWAGHGGRRCARPPIPRAREASTNGSVVTTCADERVTRARIGKKITAMAISVTWVPVPRIEIRLMARSRAGRTRIMSTGRITNEVDPSARVAGEQAERDAGQGGQPDRAGRDEQRDAEGVEQPRQHVAAEGVGAERVTERRADEQPPAVDRLGVVGGDPRGEQGGDDEQAEDRRADDQAAVGSPHRQPRRADGRWRSPGRSRRRSVGNTRIDDTDEHVDEQVDGDEHHRQHEDRHPARPCSCAG